IDTGKTLTRWPVFVDHFTPNHLTEHARQIDSILNPSVPNLSQSKNKEGTNDV
ncbi:hypothetical protein, partial [Shigella boydii]|uniref:hypothetical protein n=1 Tax=Shigella boydii TaxID=621 RepID=UPI001F4D4E87